MITDEEMLLKAKLASGNAYAKYSNFHVGACALFEDGKYYLGCNVENASYGISLCAERNAISSAIADGEKTKLVKVAIASTNTKLCYPCGACRQWFCEFCGDDFELLLEDENNKIAKYTMKDILPNAFKL